ncbi:RICIN domain-containing protein [Paraburkholderia mimosarum]|uniref:RICIN domain-containing protein n=1 Tax=Paraburkholderia mimosarum TaxID=312026 RepID=UPI0007C7C562|nr:RICIN domain-containing protein [Paraburkholderia mimosarum]
MGIYLIEYKQDRNFLLGVNDQQDGAAIVLREKGTILRYVAWDLNYDTGAITLNSSGGDLAIGADRVAHEARLSLTVYNRVDQRQRWELLKRPGFILSFADSSLCIDNDARQTNDGNQVRLYKFNGSPAQQWNFVPLMSRRAMEAEEKAISPMGSSNSSTCGRLNSPRQDERIMRRILQ